MTRQSGSRRASVACPRTRATGSFVLVLSVPAERLVGMRIEPATAEAWADLEDLFGPNGASSGCWCMYFRTTSREWAEGCRNSGATNRRGLRARFDEDPPP